MKILFFDDGKLGVLKGDAVIDVSQTVRSIPHTGPHNLISGLIERFADYRGFLEEAVKRGQGVPVNQVKIRPPLPKPGNIVCMAVNYMEDGTRAEPAPLNAFHKSPNAVIGDGGSELTAELTICIISPKSECSIGGSRRSWRGSASWRLSGRCASP